MEERVDYIAVYRRVRADFCPICESATFEPDHPEVTAFFAEQRQTALSTGYSRDILVGAIVLSAPLVIVTLLVLGVVFEVQPRDNGVWVYFFALLAWLLRGSSSGRRLPASSAVLPVPSRVSTVAS